MAMTGNSVEVMTYVTTNPQPTRDSVSFSAFYIRKETTETLNVVPDDRIYPLPNNTYLFVHTVMMPQQKIDAEDRVVYTVDLSAIPDVTQSCSERIKISGVIDLIQGKATIVSQSRLDLAVLY